MRNEWGRKEKPVAVKKVGMGRVEKDGGRWRERRWKSEKGGRRGLNALREES